MGRIILSVGHNLTQPNAAMAGTTESQEMLMTRNHVIGELEAEGVEFLAVPDALSLQDSIRWINERVIPGDVAVELVGNTLDSSARGAEVVYIYGNNQRRNDAQHLLDALLSEVPELHLPGRPRSRGAIPDTASTSGRSAFCREVAVSSLVLAVGFIDNLQDLELLQNHRDRFAKGIAKGLMQWSGQYSTRSLPGELPTVDIRIKAHDYQEKGILLNNNPFIPTDLVERLGINLVSLSEVRKIGYGNIVYIKAVDLQPFNIHIEWDEPTKTVGLNSIIRDELEGSEQIMGFGMATQQQLKTLLERHHAEALQHFPDIETYYIEEAEIEGVNYDIAFCQMCLETNYLHFGGHLQAQQNNFGGLGGVGTGKAGASFTDVRTGVKAHIQHLKAYATTAAIKQPPIVSPRFQLVPRGVAPSVYDLSGRWSAESNYGEQIVRILKQLHGVF